MLGVMALSPSFRRRVALLAPLLVLAGIVGWVLGTGNDPKGEATVVARDANGDGRAEGTRPAADGPVLEGTPAPKEAANGGAGESPHPPPVGRWSLSFEAVDADGTPVPILRAEIRDRNGEARQTAPDSRDGTGTLDVEGGGYLVVWAHARPPWSSEWLVPPPSGARHVVARMEEGLVVAGRVFQQDGVTPLSAGTADAWTRMETDPFRPSINRRRALVEKDGTFRIAGLPEGNVTLEVAGYGYEPGRKVHLEVHAGDDDLLVVLGPQGVLRFLVVDEATGLAPATVTQEIYAVKDGEETLRCSGSWVSPDEPRKAKPTLPMPAEPGETYRFRIRAQGYAPSDVLTVRIPETGGAQTVKVALRAAPETTAHLRIHVRTGDGTVPERLPVTFHKGGGSTSGSYLSLDGDGYSVDLMPGHHRLAVGEGWSPGPETPDMFWVPAMVEVDLTPGETREVDVWLARGGWAVIDGDPDPRPQKVHLTSGAETIERRAHWGTWGKGHRPGYLLGALTPGTWTLEYHGREEGRRATFEVTSRKVTAIDPASLEPLGGPGGAPAAPSDK
jgi:hypothetical protein